MPAFRPSLSAVEVDSCLREALRELGQAEKNAVLWFADVLRRKLYKELGYSSIHQYATLCLGFSQSKMFQFLRLAKSLETLPALKRSVARGEVSWTKARVVASVATPKTEQAWVGVAKHKSRRELEARVQETRAAALAAGRANAKHAALEAAGNESLWEDSGERRATPVPLPVHLNMTLSPEQYARYEALVEKLRKKGERGSRKSCCWPVWSRFCWRKTTRAPVERLRERPLKTRGTSKGGARS